MDTRIYIRLNEWRVWAENRIVENAMSLSHEQLTRKFPIGQSTLLATVEHLQKAEAIWLTRLTQPGNGVSIGDLPPLHDLTAITAAWARSNAGWEEYLTTLTEDELCRNLAGRNSRGIPFNIPVTDCLLHVYTHAGYTFAQAANIFRQLGVNVPDTAMATLSRDEHPVKE